MSAIHRAMYATQEKNDGAVDPTLPDIPSDIPSDLLDQLVTGPMTAESVDAVMRKFKKAILERALGLNWTPSGPDLGGRSSQLWSSRLY